ncbi:anthranilate synthase family protein [Streptomyces sp. WMMC1477]|uniref:anthranilate synthase family protein n=1 Tax=Streptomyces sp. WMMC1477 TaxID=3015155 RepID=UPI0022B67133|nr:anthranilate synthase family protein [Streptomyces sp. WMMC1477]MCZ7432693.1 anthranilate synthase family protein [Streptomyces sp. WMMC1477]
MSPALSSGVADEDDLFHRVLTDPPGAYALLHRPETTGTGTLDVLVGEVSRPATLAGLPLPDAPERPGHAHHELLVLVPYRQIAERGFAVPDDGAPLIALAVTDQQRIGVHDALARIPEVPISLSGGHFDVDDAAYREIVKAVVDREIGTGEGANFVIKRSFVADITDYGPHSALTFFSRLLRREAGAYWTFLVHTGERTLVGATPERHISVEAGKAVMNPISGTYSYPPQGPTLDGVMEFLADRKEADELFMVVDEELKMMARVCDQGGRVVGPYLKEMTRLAHTEYLIEGQTTRSAADILRETLLAPTVTGSPLESACRVISRYEPQGRGYYSGVAALIGRDASGRPALDSAILIRTADISAAGRVAIGVGSTLVRHSDPWAEAAETRAKADGLVAALDSGRSARFARHPRVRAALEHRNASLAEFWLRDDADRAAKQNDPLLAGLRVLVIDAEDTFTAMMKHQLTATGLAVTVRRFDEDHTLDGWDLVVLGPGPGDPSEEDDPRMRHLRATVRTLLERRAPFVAVCLSHQALSLALGFEVHRLATPNQGVQKGIDLFGSTERVGFYNTFAAWSEVDRREVPGVGLVEVSRDRADGEVYGLRGPHFASVQFHAESVLTQDGPRILATALRAALGLGPG